MGERRNRTSPEILKDAFLKRASTIQLLSVRGRPGFEEWEPEIVEILLLKRDVPFESFKTIHTTDACELQKKTGKLIRIDYGMDIDVGPVHGIGTLDVYECLSHGVTSSEFVTDTLTKNEEPYNPVYVF